MADLIQQMQASTPVTAGSVGASPQSSSDPARAVASAQPADAAAAVSVSTQGGRVKLLMQGPLHFESKDGTFTTLLFLWNSGKGREKVSFAAPLRDPKEEPRNASIVFPGAPIVLNPQDLVSTQLKLQLPDKTGRDATLCASTEAGSGPLWMKIPGASPCYPLSGVLAIHSDQTAPSKAGAKLNDPEIIPIGFVLPALPPEELQSQILQRSLWAASIPVVIGMLLAAVKKRYPWSSVAGSPDWDFGKSWSSNVTLFLGLLAALLAFGGLPAQTTILPKNSYLIMSTIAIAMIGIGPLVYASIQRDKVVGDKPARVGILATLYLAGLVVLWAAYIQFGLVWLILVELVRANVLTVATNRILDIGLTALAVVVFVYGFLSLRLVAIDSKPQPEAQGMADAALAAAPAAPPAWPLL
jgi:hypothetical protein